MDRKFYGTPAAEPSCLFPSDEEIARVLFGNDKARIRLFEQTVAAEERRGLPRKHPTYGARYWPAVKAYFDYQWGLTAEPPFAAATDEAVPEVDEIFVSSVSSITDVIERVVRAYQAGPQKAAEREIAVYEEQPSLSRAIRLAALSQLASGERHPHQLHIPGFVLLEVERRLQQRLAELEQAPDFDEVFRIVQQASSGIRGIGELAVYDIAHRIGAFLRKTPTRVYLPGYRVRATARLLGLRGSRIDPADLPRPLGRLTPAAVVDCLVLYQDQIALEGTNLGPDRRALG